MELAVKRLAWVMLWWGAACLGEFSPARAQDVPADEAPAVLNPPSASSLTEDEYFELMRVFVDTFEQIDRNYVKDIDRRDLVEAAVRGMLAKLDPYSDYISPDDLAHFTEAVEQEFGGIGIQVHWNTERREIEVMTPLPGSPAYAAGIHAGDRIVEIEGKPVAEFAENREMTTAIEMLKGQVGVDVTIGIKHPDSEDVQRMTITRGIIQLDTVLGDTRTTDGVWNFMLDDEQKIGYIRLTHFTRRSAEEMRSALQKLRDQGLQALILDLRNNPGGLLQSAVDISDMFIDEGVIVSTDGRNSRERSWYAKKFGTYSDFPMVVLINRFSASASEILSACLQDHSRAVVVGERSWGKGSVQNVIELEGGDSALKLTTASYHRPSGKNIHRFPGATEADEWGVSPDEGYLVKMSRDEWDRTQDARQKRDLPRNTAPPDSDDIDPQLQKALETIVAALKGDDAPDSATDAAAPDKPAPDKPAPDKPAPDKPAADKPEPAPDEPEADDGDTPNGSSLLRPRVRTRLPRAA